MSSLRSSYVSPHGSTLSDFVLTSWGLGIQQQHGDILIQKEIDFGFGFKNHEYIENHTEAITWFLRNKAVLGFQFRTAYLSITYYDIFLTKLSFKGDQNHQKYMLRLLSVACIFLAAKMEEKKGPSRGADLDKWEKKCTTLKSEAVSGGPMLGTFRVHGFKHEISVCFDHSIYSKR